MDVLIEQLVNSIKEDERYIAFIQAEQGLHEREVEEILSRYHQVLEEYQEVSKYKEYVDISETKQKLMEIKKEVSKSKAIQEYYQRYHAINDLLDGVTKMIFENVSDQLETSRYII